MNLTAEQTVKYRDSLFSQLVEMTNIVSDCECLSRVIDSDWCNAVRAEIESLELKTSPYESEFACLYFQLKNNHERIHLIERNLKSLHKLTNIRDELNVKIRNLKHNRYNLNYRNYMFELMVLGTFAHAGCLIDSEIPVGINNSSIDCFISICDREAFVEVTYTSQELFEAPKDEAIFVSVENMIEQVISKTHKKVAENRQLALVENSPTLLAFGLNIYGADEMAVSWACEKMFSDRKYEKLSGIIVSDHWDFSSPWIILNESAKYALSGEEIERLKKSI